jgi:uncharacterized protein DUF5677
MKDDLQTPKSEGTAENLRQMLGPRVDIEGLARETDRENVNAAVFELYKESAIVVQVAANMVGEKAHAEGGWPRNQAICAGLMVRIFKLMLVVTQLSATRNRGEAVAILNRSIMESSVNLEFLVLVSDDKFFDQFVSFSLGPERELYDLIHANIAARGGEILPVEQRMLDSITRLCRSSSVSIEEVDRKYGDGGGGLRERLKAIGKEDLYVAMQRIPSHAVHGTWVDLWTNHLEHDLRTGGFRPEVRFASVDARLLEPGAIFAIDANSPVP